MVALLLRISSTSVNIFVLCLFFLQCVRPDDIRMPPLITRGPSGQVIYKMGDLPIEIPCEASGTPAPADYEWFKNGAPLSLNNLNIVRNDPRIGTITILEPSSFDQGFYQCTAKNQWGKARSDAVQLIMASLASYPSSPTKVQLVNEGDYLMLPCQQTKVVPNATFFWATSPTEVDVSQNVVNLDSRVTQDDNGNLHFAHVTQSDYRNGYIYKCQVKNVYLDQTIGGSYVKLDIQKRVVDQVKPLVRASTPLQIVGIKGRNVNLRCIFSGKDAPKVTWEKVNGVFPPARVSSMLTDTVLTIKKLEMEDQGSYKCTGSNNAGSDSKTIALEIQVIPEFLKPNDAPHDINVTEGNDVVINCRTNAIPAASVVWYINGNVYNGGNNRRRVSQDGTSLTLSKLCRDCSDGTTDLMVVTCNASNIHGYAYVSGYVNILKKTEMTVKPEDVTMVYPYDVNITCGGVSDPSTPVTVEWFDKNGNRLFNETDKIAITQNDAGVSLLRVIIKTDEDKGRSRSGAYFCYISNGYSNFTKDAVISEEPEREPEPIVIQTAMIDWWIILIIIVAMLLIFIIMLICCVCVKRCKGDVYKVDESEIKNGNNPKQELLDSGFKGYVRQEQDAPLRSSRGSFGSRMSMNSETGSLGEYEADYGKFNEEGSFIGAYKGDQRSPAYATNV